MKRFALFVCLTASIQNLAKGEDRDQRISDLERQLTEAKHSVAALQKTIESLSAEVEELRQPEARSAAPTTAAPGGRSSKEAGGEPAAAADEFANRIIGPENGSQRARPYAWRQSRRSSFRRDIPPLLSTDLGRHSIPTFD